METTTNVIDKNWKALIKPNKLDITSNEDKTIAKVVAEPLEKDLANHRNSLEEYYYHRFGCSGDCYAIDEFYMSFPYQRVRRCN